MTLEKILNLFDPEQRVVLQIDKQHLTGKVGTLTALLNDTALQAAVDHIDLTLGELKLCVRLEAGNDVHQS